MIALDFRKITFMAGQKTGLKEEAPSLELLKWAPGARLRQ